MMWLYQIYFQIWLKFCLEPISGKLEMIFLCETSATILSPFRKYQSFVEQHDMMISLHILLNEKINLTSYRSSSSSDKFYERMNSRTNAHLEEFDKLASKLNARRKYLEQKIKDRNLKKKFVDNLNLRKIILFEINQCCETEKNLFIRLNSL